MDRHRGGAADRYGDSRPYRNSRAPPPPPPRGDGAYPMKKHHNNHNHTSPDGSYFNSGFSSGGRDRGGVNSPPRFSGGGGGGRGPGFRGGGGRGGSGNFDQRSPNGGGGRGGMGNFDKQGPGSGGGRGGAGNFDQRGPSGGGGRGNFDHQGPPASGGGYGPGNFDQQGVVGGGERGNFDYHGPITGGGYGHGNFDQQGPISGGERGNFDHQGPVSRGGRGGVVNYDEQGPVSVGGRGGMSNFDQQGPISGRAHGDFDQQGPLSGGARGNFEQQDSVSGGGRGNFDRQGPISGGRGNFDQQGPVSGVGRGNFDQQGPVSGGGRGGAVNFDHQGPVISGGRGGAVNFDQQGPTTGGGRGGRVDFDPQGPVTGHKRGYPFSAPAVSPDNQDGGAFAKLFVGSVPRTATEEDIRPLFDQHGRVLEVALIKDKKTGQQQGCCFIKYATSGEADRAIRALHNQHTLPGGVGPIQVRYADGERERLGAVEYKLFVGSLNKQAIEKEVEEIFSPYGRVEDVYLMRDEMKQSRGCGFVKYSSRESAMAAINSLSGSYIMRGCDQPLTVRFADPKRPRPGESRNGPSFGGPGFGPRFQPPGLRPMPNTIETTHNHNLPNTWHPMSPQNQVPSDVGIHTRFPAPSTPGGSSSGGFSGSADGSSPVFPVSSSTVPQNYNQSKPQVPSFSQQITPVQQQPYHSSQQYPSSMQSQSAGSYPQKQTSVAQTPYSQTYSSQKQPGVNGQLPVSLSHNQQNLPPASTQIPSNNNVPPQSLPGIANQPQLNPQQQFPQPLHQSPSQLTAQMLSQQTQALQARLQSSQQAFSQIQQQLQMMQPSNQSFTMQQGPKASSQQTSWDGMTPQTSASSKVNPPVADGPSAATAPSVIPEMTHTAVPLKCNWTEHTSPEGFKYYYNSTTGESKWEKPEELSSFEKQQTQLQKSSVQQPQSQFQPQGLPTQQVPPNPQGQFQPQLQPQLRYPPQLQQPSQSSSYQAPGYAGHQGTQDIAYKQSPAVASSVNDPSRFQQGLQGSQEWMWKNNPTGA
ncbi:flowering time control protein FCA isoform X1 [Daucus carota subsp. sativus]|uniref:flowering time control protein FCA isoform X1 n=1 Tax=Daucus carota subsp. sativus TaxID=79200 RepID=UPI0007F01F66|nr:PREDICTED: flowering time control protein FCA isoform X1 [Daucus carota subsp. sativus]